MRVFIDDLIFCLQNAGGISVYWSELMKRMNNSNNKVDITCLHTHNYANNVLANEINWKGKKINEPVAYVFLKRFFPLKYTLPQKSIFHSSYLRYSLQKNVANIVTIHDLAPEHNMISSKTKHFRKLQQYLALKNANGVICVSNTVRNDLLNYYTFLKEENVVTIYHGVKDDFFSNINNIKPTKNFVLFVGHRTGYKNFAFAVNVMQQLSHLNFIIVGGKPLTIAETTLLNKKLPNRYQYLSLVNTGQLNNLYNNATCLLYPSTYEGFGLPIIEAMKVGCPVITTNNAAIPEIANNAAIALNNLEIIDFVEAIKSICTNDLLKNNLITKGKQNASRFLWDDTYTKTINFYTKIWQQNFL